MDQRRKKLLWIVVGTSIAFLVAFGTFYGLRGRGLGTSELRTSYRLVGYWREADGQSFREPHGIAVDPRNGNVLMSDTLNHRIVIFDPSGNFLLQFGREGNGPGEFAHAKGIAVGPDGSIYVSDFFQDRIQKFSEAGQFLLEWGKSGEEEDAFDSPAGLAVDGNSNVYAADFYNSVVKVFTPKGQLLRRIGSPGQWGSAKLDYPTDVDVASDGAVTVADAYNYRIQTFSPSGRPQGMWGWHLFGLIPRPNHDKRGFNVPTGVALTQDKKWVHVADSRNHRVVMLDSKGSFVTAWQLSDVGENIDTPVMIAVSHDGQRIYVSDIVRHRILILEPVSLPVGT